MATLEDRVVEHNRKRAQDEAIFKWGAIIFWVGYILLATFS